MKNRRKKGGGGGVPTAHRRIPRPGIGPSPQRWKELKEREEGVGKTLGQKINSEELNLEEEWG